MATAFIFAGKKLSTSIIYFARPLRTHVRVGKQTIQVKVPGIVSEMQYISYEAFLANVLQVSTAFYHVLWCQFVLYT